MIFFETGDFWKDLSLASVAAQVYWDTHQHGNETDADAETRQGLWITPNSPSISIRSRLPTT